jgi:hypothetical protein
MSDLDISDLDKMNEKFVGRHAISSSNRLILLRGNPGTLAHCDKIHFSGIDGQAGRPITIPVPVNPGWLIA